MKGYKTFIVAALMGVLPALSEWLLGIDWVSVLTGAGIPQVAVVPLAFAIAGAITGLLRGVTTTAPGKES